MLRSNGVMNGMTVKSPARPGAVVTREKVFWWSPGFHPIGTPDPPLKIEGRRLDSEAPRLAQPWVTNASVPEWGGWTMLIMLELPTPGCWEVKGSYYGDSVTCRHLGDAAAARGNPRYAAGSFNRTTSPPPG